MNVFLRKATINDFESFFLLRSDPINIKWSGHEKSPQKEELKLWYIKQLEKQERIIYLAVDATNTVIGYCYLDIHSPIEFEIAYGVYSAYSGRGIGSNIVYNVLVLIKSFAHSGAKVFAWVSVFNYGSRKILLNNGFSETNKKEHRTLILLPDACEFTLWEKKI